MDDCFQLRKRLPVSEHPPAKSRAVDLATWTGQFTAEPLQNRLVCRSAGSHHLVRDNIGIDSIGPK